MTHFAEADDQDPTFTHQQLARFTAVLDQLRAAGMHIPLAHVANTAGILHHAPSHLDAVRPGIGLYGYELGASAARAELRPVLSWTTHIVQLRALQPGHSVSYNRTFRAGRSSRIAILPVGYADGYNRLLSNKGWVLVHGRRAPVVGRVCMDMTMIDVTDIPQAKMGDEVVLIGTQGDDHLTAADLAAWQGTIPYEVLCAIGPRVRRAYTALP